MAKLMDHHIVNDFDRCQDQPPGKTQYAPGTARPPACSRGTDSYLLILKLVSFSNKADALRDDLFCPCPVPVLKGLFRILHSRYGHLKTSIQHQPCSLSLHDRKRVCLPKIWECPAGDIFPLQHRHHGSHLRLFLKYPVRMFLCELTDQFHGHPERRAHDQRPILLDHQGDRLAPGANDFADLDPTI